MPHGKAYVSGHPKTAVKLMSLKRAVFFGDEKDDVKVCPNDWL